MSRWSVISSEQPILALHAFIRELNAESQSTDCDEGLTTTQTQSNLALVAGVSSGG
ncbi:hypothetical protein BDM02DRAFT_3118119 [Thelephora ganbajun]|uniref:Uncharacterized protein n=1 Tax=Thelephora ganbajun TaxID=370292 RepID=A0ACB6ZBA2_THEGA|nr:hypothetical protein BDM02DRAFT_3118119 [Thelephora ganbajun]